jgi:DNA-binding NarL/FixJ family response regulator
MSELLSEGQLFPIDTIYQIAHNCIVLLFYLFGGEFPMTLLLFVPNDDILIFSKSNMPGDELAAAIRRGEWQPPIPVNSSDLLSYQVSCQGRFVVVMPATPDLTGKTTHKRPLSSRQRQVLTCLAEGLTDKQIAARLGVNIRTIAHHVAQIKTRFGASTRAQTLHMAADQGFF